jgi:hypothetical protein
LAKYYGFVSGSLRAVFDSWEKVDAIRLQYPYASYRKFYSEEKAWEWVRSKSSRASSTRVTKYGSIFKNHYVTIDYTIDKRGVFYNIDTSKIGYLKIVSREESVIVENRASHILVEVRGLILNPSLIVSHLVAVHTILQIVGPYIDCEIKLYNYSIFAALQLYKGNVSYVARTRDFIKERKARVAWTT